MKLRRLLLISSMCCYCHYALWAQEAGKTPGSSPGLTLPEALARVAERNPELAVSALEIRAAAARVAQAGARPNPEIQAYAENMSFPVTGNGIFYYTESTLDFSQRLELGNKRNLRIRAAEKDVAVASSELAARKADLMTTTSLAFAEVLAAQERLENQRELSRLAQQSYVIVGERVTAGKVSPVEQTRAAVALASAQLEEEKHQRALAAAKDWLASLWGGSGADIGSVQGRFEIPPLAAANAEGCLQNNPEMKLVAAAADARSATLELEKANRKPDLTVNAGLRRLSYDHQLVWVAGASIPVAIFDRRKGAIAEAQARLEQSLAEARALEWKLRAGLVQARHDHENALLEARAIQQGALPAAKDAAAAVAEGYRLGKFEFLNVLDAQRTFAELNGKYIEAVASGLKAAIEVERLARCDSAAGREASGK